jgi:hypothetical protein
MTVGELMEHLKKLDKNLIICKNGYEGGYTEQTLEIPYIADLYLNVNTEWYYGEHEAKPIGFDGNKYEKGQRVIL